MAQFVNAQRIGTQAVALQPTDEIAFADLIFMVSPENPTHIDIDTPLQNLSHQPKRHLSACYIEPEVASSTSPVTLHPRDKNHSRARRIRLSRASRHPNDPQL